MDLLDKDVPAGIIISIIIIVLACIFILLEDMSPKQAKIEHLEYECKVGYKVFYGTSVQVFTEQGKGIPCNTKDKK